ncbi:MAG: HupE/UreJ family protein [Bacteroidota bacterium]
MFQEVSIYLQLGFEHILDWQGYDHMLFILALCAAYSLKQWKSVLILVTAFTIGHSITLALSALDIFRLDETLIERLIPLTILITAVYHLFAPEKGGQFFSRWVEYLLALGFGFIHGMGFSSYFRALMSDSEAITTPLLGFNLGIEGGQIIFVLVVLGIASLMIDAFKLPRIRWQRMVSGVVGLIAIYLLFR